MAYWEFLIQREGDRGWRSVKTGNLQLVEGTYRIIAKSDLTNATIHTRVTHQTFDSTAPQQQAQSRTQNTNTKGLLAIIPPMHLAAGIWQFLCSGENADRFPTGDALQTLWHRMLKLRVLPVAVETPSESIDEDAGNHIPTHPDRHAHLLLPLSTHSDSSKDKHPIATSAIARFSTGEAAPTTAAADLEDPNPPTQPLVPISTSAAPESETWADGLTRLLEQLERESLQSQTATVTIERDSGSIQIRSIVDLPSQLIGLNRSTFSSIIPGNRLTINGQCNLQLLNPRLIQRVKVEKLAICLRHPHTSEIVTSIECDLPIDRDRFAFDGRLDVPSNAKISLLLGEVNLYDKHHIQVGTSGFTVALNLNPLHESDLSLLRTLDRDRLNSATALEKLNRELKIEAAAAVGSTLLSPQIVRVGVEPAGGTASSNENRWRSLSRGESPQPTIPIAYQPDSFLEQREDITPVETAPPDCSSFDFHPRHSSISRDITGDLEIDFAAPDSDFFAEHRRHYPRNYKNLEVVVDD